MFSRENSKLQMIETAHVNERKHASTNQHPVGDDVSQRQHPVRKHRVLRGQKQPASTDTMQTATQTGKMQRMKEQCSAGAEKQTGNVRRLGERAIRPFASLSIMPE